VRGRCEGKEKLKMKKFGVSDEPDRGEEGKGKHEGETGGGN
jgi:hypothetical protein